jgi:hypothetical protein
MEIGVKAWLALIATACFAVAVPLLPPERIQLGGPEKRPEQVRHETVLSEIRQAHAALQLTRWSDSLEALVMSEPVVGEPVRVGFDWQSVSQGLHPDAPIGVPVVASLTFADLDGDRPDCFTLHTRPAEGSAFDFSALPVEQLPDPCRVVDRFGVPGARIGEWLDRGAWDFGSSRERVFVDYRRLRDRSYSDWPYFGSRKHPLATASAVAGGCMAGDPADCESAVLDPFGGQDVGSELSRAAESSPVSFAELDWIDESPFSYLDDSLFAELEAEFGAEAFARFWSSEQEVPTAFAAAFGVELGDWVLAWVDVQMGTSRAGPGIPFGDLGLAILVVAAMTAVASRVAMRRRVP